MTGIRKILANLWLAIERPGKTWQLFCVLPRLLMECVFFRKSILWVTRNAGIGDIICTLPSVGTLKQQFPQSFVIYETSRDCMSMVRCCRHVDLVVEAGSLAVRVLPRLFKPKMKFRPLMPDEYRPPQPCGRIHIIEEFRKSFGLAFLTEQSTRLDLSEHALRQVKQRLRQEQLYGKPFVVFHTGPTWKVREWTEEGWSKLAAQLQSKCELAVIQIGTDKTSYGEIRQSPIAAGARNWLGTLTMDQTLALLSLADLVVGIDSGMLHMAGAVNAPCVGIFGAVDPECRLPRNGRAVGVTGNVSCLGCHHDVPGPRHWKSGCPNNIQCMEDISVEDVFTACVELLHQTRSKS